MSHLYHPFSANALNASGRLQWLSFRSFVSLGDYRAPLRPRSHVPLKADSCLRYPRLRMRENPLRPRHARGHHKQFHSPSQQCDGTFSKGKIPSSSCSQRSLSQRSQSKCVPFARARAYTSVRWLDLCCRVTLSVSVAHGTRGPVAV